MPRACDAEVLLAPPALVPLSEEVVFVAALGATLCLASLVWRLLLLLLLLFHFTCGSGIAASAAGEVSDRADQRADQRSCGELQQTSCGRRHTVVVVRGRWHQRLGW